MKVIEIQGKKKPIKVKKLKQPKIADIDFSSIHNLVGNKLILEQAFQLTKIELING